MKRTASIPATSLLALALAAGGCGKEKTCPPDETNVGGTCYALQSDPNNCGTRGNVCGAAQGCSAGTCVDCASSSGLCTTAVLAACFNLAQVRPLGAGLAASDAPLATDAGPNGLARLGTKIYVANSTSSTISSVTLSPPSATNGSASFPVSNGSAGFTDLENVAVHDGLVWVTNAATNTLVSVDPVSGAAIETPLAQHVGDAPFPQGFDFAGTKAYVALNGTNQVAVVDLAATPRHVTYIDVSPQAHAGASAGPARVVTVGTRVYVTLNDLFDLSFVPVAGAYGKLLTIDPATDTIVGAALDLGAGCWDASGLTLSGTTLWVACGFFDFFGTKTVSGGSIVPVELASGTPVAGAAIPLPNAATSVAICNGRGYAGMSDSGTVTSFDPSTRAVLGSAVVCPVDPGKASFVPALACPN